MTGSGTGPGEFPDSSERDGTSPHGDPSNASQFNDAEDASFGEGESEGDVSAAVDVTPVTAAGAGVGLGVIKGTLTAVDATYIPSFIAHCMQGAPENSPRAYSARRLWGIMQEVLVTNPIEWISTEGDGRCLFSSVLSSSLGRLAPTGGKLLDATHELCDVVTGWLSSAWQLPPGAVKSQSVSSLDVDAKLRIRDHVYARDGPGGASTIPPSLTVEERMQQLEALKRGAFRVDEGVLFAIMLAIECVLKLKLTIMVPHASTDCGPALMPFDGRPTHLCLSSVDPSTALALPDVSVLWFPELLHFDGIRPMEAVGSPDQRPHLDASGGDDSGSDSTDGAERVGPGRRGLPRKARPAPGSLGPRQDQVGGQSQVLVGDLNVCLLCATLYIQSHKEHTEGARCARQIRVRELVVEVHRANPDVGTVELLTVLTSHSKECVSFTVAKARLSTLLLHLLKSPGWPAHDSLAPVRHSGAATSASNGGAGHDAVEGDAPQPHEPAPPQRHGDDVVGAGSLPPT